MTPGRRGAGPSRASSPVPPSRWTDVNLAIAGLLGDMAAIQTEPHRRRAYAHAAAAIRDLDRPIDERRSAAGRLPVVPHVGPSSTRIIVEWLDHGRSPTVEDAVDASGRRAEVERRRRLRDGFLSRAAALDVLSQSGRYDGHRCDLQMHSTWSDGREPLDALIEGCLARGYTHAAITDHAAGLPVAGGQTLDGFRRQAAEIAALNARCAGRFTLLKGVEADVAADGTLDLDDGDLAEFDLVVAAVHSGLRSVEDQTARLLATVTRPGVHVLGHPRGRQFGTRAGVRADWPAVFAAAARHGVAVEFDGDPARQDLDAAIALQAVEAGCLFALDSDAHAPSELGYVDTAMAHARLAAVPPDRVVNTWPLDRLREWAAARCG
jgi:putative hydrolase